MLLDFGFSLPAFRLVWQKVHFDISGRNERNISHDRPLTDSLSFSREILYNRMQTWKKEEMAWMGSRLDSETKITSGFAQERSTDTRKPKPYQVTNHLLGFFCTKNSNKVCCSQHLLKEGQIPQACSNWGVDTFLRDKGRRRHVPRREGGGKNSIISRNPLLPSSVLKPWEL